MQVTGCTFEKTNQTKISLNHVLKDKNSKCSQRKVDGNMKRRIELRGSMKVPIPSIYQIVNSGGKFPNFICNFMVESG